jgi:ribosomal protein S1/HrpA-like RNA helicase
VDRVTGPSRGMSSSTMRHVSCKDCIREVEAGIRDADNVEFTYNEAWAIQLVERGGSRSDRCREHRQKHRTNTQGIAVAYIDLETVGEVADRENPTGPLGGLGPLPGAHAAVDGGVDLEQFGFGMDDSHIREMLEKLSDPNRRVLVLKAGTGTGKSTFGPYRLMDPPPGVAFRLTDLGPIVVTEPRVQATTGVATFVGEKMSGAGGVGPGYPVGYQVSGDRNHDDACQLVYVTDGTMINWLREGRLSKIGTVIVDEAHERSTNIDFILGYLKRELHRYPHLRVIVTSATFSVPFYEEYFGGPDLVHTMEVPAVKSVGYGMPLFGDLDVPGSGEQALMGPDGTWTDHGLPLTNEDPVDPERFIRAHWPTRYAPPLTGDEVTDPAEIEWEEDLWDTTRKLIALRYTAAVIATTDWKARMPDVLTKFVVDLARGLDEAGIFGDILGFLPTTRTIEPACDAIKAALGDRAEVFPLIASLDKRSKQNALAPRRKGETRKIVISTNLAETSLTVEGVRFVVDAGIIAQSEWDPDLAQGGIPTKPHSQAGIKQRWGRVGRKAPGWVFPLYTKSQYVALAEDTPPGSTRDNLESLVMTAKMGGIDDVVGFPWPAAFEPQLTELDQPATESRKLFLKELARADQALRTGGAVDVDGHPTSFGRELVRFQGLGSVGSALAILYADRLGCVPEVVTVLTLLEDTRMVGKDSLLLSDFEWPDEWRVEAAERHRGLASVCSDDADLVLQISAGWERADPQTPPWEPSRARRDWARVWWVNDTLLLAAAEARREILQALSPAMKEQVKRLVEPALLKRTRGVLTRAFNGLRYDRLSNGFAPPVLNTAGDEDRAQLELDSLFPGIDGSVIALRRRLGRDNERYIGSLVTLEPWALPADDVDPATDAMRLLLDAATHARPDASRNIRTALVDSWPVGQRMRLTVDPDADGIVEYGVLEITAPFERPMTAEEGRAEKTERREQRKSARLARAKRAATVVGVDDRPEATDDDQSGELDTLRPEAQRISDEEQLAQAAFAEADMRLGMRAVCGRCPQCLSGFPDLCEDPGTDEIGRTANDALQSWNDRAVKNIDVSTPALFTTDVTAADGSAKWEVAGYEFDDAGRPRVRLRPDWRTEDAPANPAHHREVESGQPIDVVVGPMVRDHRDALRTFIRADGRGRFIVREASPGVEAQERRSEIAASLNRGVHGLLEGLVEGQQLTATVVAARGRGCFTITLLELLDQHHAAAAPGKGMYLLTADPTKESGDRVEWRTGTVVAPADAWGNVRVKLSVCDSTRGIHHYVNIRHGGSTRPEIGDAFESQPRPGSVEASGSPGYAAGQPVAVRLQRAQAKLPLSGKDLYEVEQICAEADKTLRIRNAPEKPRRADDRKDDDLEPWTGGSDTRLTSERETPLSRASATALAALDDSAAWQNRVWSFWARSHHLRPSDEHPIRPYEPTDDVEIEATVTIDTSTRLEVRRAAFAAATANLTPGSDLTGKVTSVRSGTGAFVEVAPDVVGLVRNPDLRWEPVTDATTVVALGDEVRVRVLDFDPDGLTLGLSTRLLLPHPVLRWAERHPAGYKLTARVTRVTQAGVFVALSDGVDGWIPSRELSWGTESEPRDLVGVGDELRVQVIGLDENRRRMNVSVKALLAHPIESFAAAHPVGTDLSGTVSKAVKRGLFVRLADGLDGLVHVSEISWEKVQDPTSAAHECDRVDVRIIEYDIPLRRVSLSMKARRPDPLVAFQRAHPLRSEVIAEIVRLADRSVLVALGPGVEGRIPMSEISWQRIDAPADVLTVGQRVTARILEFDLERREVKLSIKQTLPQPFEAFVARYVTGSVVTGRVASVTDFGAFVEFPGGAQGLIHISKLSAGYISHPSQVVTPEDWVSVRVLSIDSVKRKISLAFVERVAGPRAPASPPRPTTASTSPPATLPRAPTAQTRPAGPVRPAARRPDPRPRPPTRVPARTARAAPKRIADAYGNTIALAAESAARSLGLSTTDVTIDVLTQPRTGLFGRIKQQARVRVTER